MTNNEKIDNALKWALENPARSDNALEILNANSDCPHDPDSALKDTEETLKALEPSQSTKG